MFEDSYTLIDLDTPREERARLIREALAELENPIRLIDSPDYLAEYVTPETAPRGWDSVEGGASSR